MIKLRKLIKEHAWDRKFGEPLPTLKDVAEKHQRKPNKRIVEAEQMSSEEEAEAMKVFKKGASKFGYKIGKIFKWLDHIHMETTVYKAEWGRGGQYFEMASFFKKADATAMVKTFKNSIKALTSDAKASIDTETKSYTVFQIERML